MTDSEVRCLYQVFKPKLHVDRPGWGDCTICTHDPEHNGNCKGYSPIRVYTFQVGTCQEAEQVIPQEECAPSEIEQIVME